MQSLKKWSVTTTSETWEEAGQLPINQPERYVDIPDDQKEIVTKWIKNNFFSICRANNRHTSYGLKHIFEHADVGFYMTNGEFKGAMIASGYKPTDYGLNCSYRISQRSPAFDYYRPGYDQTKGIR